MTTESYKKGAAALSRMNFSGYAGHATSGVASGGQTGQLPPPLETMTM